MGNGAFDARKFNLTISLRYNASNPDLDQWRESFKRASELLFNATDGQHQFGTIYYGNNCIGGRNADAWLLDIVGTANSGGYPGLGNETVHQTLYSTEKFRPFVILHEFGHYAYALRDEYLDADGVSGVVCIGGTTANACIMEVGPLDGDRFGNAGQGGNLVLGRVSEFCVALNHDPNHDTWQHAAHGKSCWETMVNRPFSLRQPSGLPQKQEPAGHVPINWNPLVAEQRFMLVVGRSDSMAGNKLAEAKCGAAWWVDHSVFGDFLGIVSYSNTAIADYPLQQIMDDSDRSKLQDAIDRISAGGKSAIGGGLREALNQIRGAEGRAATQVVVLLSDGRYDSGEDPRGVLPDLVSNGVRVYTIGIGPSIDAALLEQVATSTGGIFYHINPALSQANQEFEIRLAFQEISGIARENGGLVTTISGSTNPGVREEEVFIEPGSEMATFVLSWKKPEDLLSLELVSPEGRSIMRDSAPDNVRPIYSKRPYVGFRVEAPVPGTWRLIVKPEEVTEVADFRLFVFSQNRRIDGGIISPQRFYELGEVIPLQFQIYFDQPITGLRIDGRILSPDGGRSELEFSDDGNRELGDELSRDGLYSTLFRKTQERGTYTVELSVESDGQSAAYPETREWLHEGETHKYDPIPPFRRQFRLAVAVGAEQPE